MGRGDLTILEAARSLRLSPWRGYAAGLLIYALATTLVFLALPAVREALFICYLPAIVLATLLGGSYAGLGVAIGGGLVIWFWLYPVASSHDALALMLYVDAAVALLYIMDLLNRAFEAVLNERDRARLLFSESQHRIANNLMFIAGFLRSERREARGDPARAVASLEQAVQRLDTFSTIHRQLSVSGEMRESLPALFRRLTDSLIQAAGAHNVTATIEVEPVELGFEQTLLLALLLTETVINALKYAFEGRESGRILIRFSSVAGMHLFEVSDNGRGFSGVLDQRASPGGGHRIIDMLAAQLGGTLTLTNEDGLRTSLTFPRHQSTSPTGLASVFLLP